MSPLWYLGLAITLLSVALVLFLSITLSLVGGYQVYLWAYRGWREDSLDLREIQKQRDRLNETQTEMPR